MVPKNSRQKQSSAHLKGVCGKSPEQVNKRNARERNRVEKINNGFRDLAYRLSNWTPLKNKKISKAETLKWAVQYIQHLQELLQFGESSITVSDFDFDEDMQDMCEMSPESVPVSESPDHNSSSSSSSSSSSTISIIDHRNYYYHLKEPHTAASASPVDYSIHQGYDSGYPSPNYTQQGVPLAPIHQFYGDNSQQWRGSPIFQPHHHQPQMSNHGYYLGANM